MKFKVGDIINPTIYSPTYALVKRIDNRASYLQVELKGFYDIESGWQYNQLSSDQNTGTLYTDIFRDDE